MNEKQLLNYIKHEVDLKNNLPVYASSLMDIECQTSAAAFLINFAAYFDQMSPTRTPKLSGLRFG